MGNEWNMEHEHDLIRERDRTDMVFCGSMLLLTLRATYTPAVCGAFVLLG